MKTSRLLARLAVAAVMVVAVTACGDGGELDEVRAQLAVVVAERDALRHELDAGYVHPEAGEPTERQTEMIEVVRQFLDAVNAEDPELAASLMTINGVVRFGGWVSDWVVEDGSLVPQQQEEPPITLAMLAREFSEPMLIAGDQVAVATRLPGMFSTQIWVFGFISTGAVKIMTVQVVS